MSVPSSLELIDESLDIPTLPAIVGKLNDLLEKPETSATDVGKLVAQDAPIASRVLRIVNSAHYGLRTEVLSLDQACAILGMRVLRNIVMQASVIEQFKSTGAGTGFDVEDLWRHNILSAQVAQAAAKQCGAKLGLTPDEFYTCALLHDLGMVALLDGRSGEYAEVLRQARETERPLPDVEAEAFGYTHADVGARIAFRWKLPEGVVGAIQFHHGPEEEIEGDPTVALVHLVSRLCACVVANDLDGARELLTDDFAADLGLGREDYEGLVELAAERLSAIEI